MECEALFKSSTRWYATPTPVIPAPMMQMSALLGRGSLLPWPASGFASGEESIQKERVGLGDGSLAGVGCSDGGVSSTLRECSSLPSISGLTGIINTLRRKQKAKKVQPLTSVNKIR